MKNQRKNYNFEFKYFHLSKKKITVLFLYTKVIYETKKNSNNIALETIELFIL